MHGEVPDNTDTTFSAAPGGVRPELPPPPPDDTPPPNPSGESHSVVKHLQAVIHQAQSAQSIKKTQPETQGQLLKSPWLRKFLPTILVSFSVYYFLFGLEGAAIVIALFTIHEMGHWIWMKANKLDPQPPVYIPLFGAFVMMKQPPEDEATAAWVALAGPLVGGAGAAVLLGIGVLAHHPPLIFGAFCGFLLNLMQLLPARPLDGGAIVAAISRHILVPGTILLVVAAIWSRSPLLILISFISILTLFHKPTRPAPKLAHSGKAKTLLELEHELLAKAQGATASVPQPQAAADPASSRGQLIRATVKQRFAVGGSYLGLGAALCGMTVVSIHIITNNLADYANIGIGMFNQLMLVKPESSVMVQRSYCYGLQENYVQAEKDAQAAVKLNDRNHAAYYAVATFQLMQGKNDEVTADNFYKAVTLSKPGSLEAWTPAYGLLLTGHYDKALESCSRLTDGSDNAVKAVVLDRTGSPEDAQSFYDASVKSSKWGPRARRALYFLGTNQIDKAKSDIDELTKVPLDPPLIRLVKGWYELKIGNTDQALKLCDSVWDPSLFHSDLLESDYEYAAAHRLKSQIYTKKAALEANTHLKGKYLSWAAYHYDKSRQIPGLGTLYIPRDVDTW